MKKLILTFLFLSGLNAFAAEISALKITESYVIPEREISGMAWRLNPDTKKRELIVAGDHSHKIYIIDWENRKAKLNYKVVDLKPLEKKTATDKSEWESIFSDETGRVFLIKENPPSIQVVSPNFDKIETTINLVVPESSNDITGWDNDDNSGSEGILPLANGHVLVVKEKNPLRILEFSPTGNKGYGYKPELSIETKGKFPIPESPTVSFHLASTFKFSPKDEALLEDSSGLNVDYKGTLYLLSDQRNLIAKIGNSLKPNGKDIKIKHVWSLPSDIKQPEGMVIDEQNRPIIAIDSKKTDKPNLFLLSPMND